VEGSVRQLPNGTMQSGCAVGILAATHA